VGVNLLLLLCLAGNTFGPGGKLKTFTDDPYWWSTVAGKEQTLDAAAEAAARILGEQTYNLGHHDGELLANLELRALWLTAASFPRVRRAWNG
jgi:hypothetical protein